MEDGHYWARLKSFKGKGWEMVLVTNGLVFFYGELSTVDVGSEEFERYEFGARVAGMEP